MNAATRAVLLLPFWALTTTSAAERRGHDELLAQARSASCEERGDAAQELLAGKKADPAFAEVLRGSLVAKDGCNSLWFAAGEYFEAHPQPSLFEPLLAALKASLPEPRDVAHNLARALGATRDPRAFGVLSGILENSKLHAFARAGAAVGLGRTGDPKAIAILEKMITDQDPAEYGAIEGLGVAKSRKSLPLLEELLEQPPHTDEAAEALGEIGDSAAVPKMLSLLFIPDPRSRLKLVDALAHFDAPSIDATFRFIACFDGSRRVRFAATEYLEHKKETLACDTSLGGTLRRWMHGREISFDPGSTLTPANAGKIAAALSDSEPTVRLLAAADLGALHQPSSAPAIEAALAKESNPRVKTALGHALERAKAGEAGFLARLHDKDPMVRGTATYQLIATGLPDREALLAAQLEDPEAAVRWEIEEAALFGTDPICNKQWAPRFAARRKLATDEREQRELDQLVKLCGRLDPRPTR